MTSAPAKIFDTDGMEQVMQTFDDTKAWNLPVVDEEGRYQGFVSKSKIPSGIGTFFRRLTAGVHFQVWMIRIKLVALCNF